MIKDKYSTPKWLLDTFDDWFDPCPIDYNPETHENGLEIDWKDKTYVNPPYSKPMPWIEKAIEERKKGKRIVMLLKVDTSTKWYAKLVEANAHIFWYSRRIKFAKPEWKYNKGTPATFPSMLVVL